MKASRSNLALLGLFSIFSGFLFFFFFSPLLFSRLISTCQSLFFSCRNALFSFLSSPVFYFWLPSSLFFLAFSLSLGRLTLSSFYLSRLEKKGNWPKKLTLAVASEPRLKNFAIFLLKSKKPFALARGLKKPSIFLSEALVKKLEKAELKAVLLHEASHLEKSHYLKLLLASFFRDFLFFLPFAHQLYFSFLLHKEIEADEETIKGTGSPLYLARALLKIARFNLSFSSFPGYHSPNTLSYRLKNLLKRLGKEEEEKRKPWLKSLAISLLILALLFTSLGFVFPSPPRCFPSCSTAFCCQPTED